MPRAAATNRVAISTTPFQGRVPINGNKVKNGDFEYAPNFTAITTTSARWIDGTAGGSTTNDVFKWYLINGAGTFGASFDTSTKFAGTASLKLEATDATGRGRALSAPFESTTTALLVAQYGIPAQPSTDYDLSAYIKTASASASSVRFQALFFTADGTQSGSSNGTFQSATQDFTLSTLRFTTASTTRFIVIKLDDNTSPGAAHQVWFDDVKLTPVYPEGRVPANGNLVKNFDFEVAPTFVAATTTAARWIEGNAAGSSTNSTYKYAIPSGSVGGGGSANFDSAISRSGTSSLKLSTNGVGGSISVTQYITLAEGIALGTVYRLLPSTSYTLTGWIKTSNAAAGSVTLSCRELNAAKSTVATNTSSAVNGTADWTQVTVTFTTAASTVYGALIFRNNVTGNTSDAWFDDIYLAKTEVTPVALTAATGSFTINDNSLLEGRVCTTNITITDYTVMTGGNFNFISGFLVLTEGVDFDAVTSNDVTATNFADAMNAVQPGAAVAVGAVVTISLPGDNDGGTIVWSGTGVTPTTATLTGGLDAYKILVNGLGFTFGADITVGANATATVVNMEAALTPFPIPDCSFVANGNVLEITSTLSGSAGNATTISVTGSSGGPVEDDIVASGATLSGGTDAVTGVYPGRIQIT